MPRQLIIGLWKDCSAVVGGMRSPECTSSIMRITVKLYFLFQKLTNFCLFILKFMALCKHFSSLNYYVQHWQWKIIGIKHPCIVLTVYFLDKPGLARCALGNSTRGFSAKLSVYLLGFTSSASTTTPEKNEGVTNSCAGCPTPSAPLA